MRVDPFSHLPDPREGREDGQEPPQRVPNDDLKPAKGVLWGLALMLALYFAIAVIVALV